MIGQLFIILSILFIYFSVGWFYSFHVKVFAWIDFLWSSAFLLVLSSLIILTPSLSKAQIILMVMYAIWSVRLSSYLAIRIRKNGEDKRYITLIHYWKVWYGLKFYLLYIGEGILVVILSLPLFLKLTPQLSNLQYLAIIVFFFSLLMETLADRQLNSFSKNQVDGHSKVCDIGLWKYSRHPNYFFETMIWFSYGLFVVEANNGLTGFIPYIIMLFLITQVTGIPPAEESSMKSKPQAYKYYQRRTSKFIPWFTKTLVIAVLLFHFSGEPLMATEVPPNQVARIEKVFNELRADNLTILDQFYDDNVLFKDPIGEHKGLTSVKGYYQNLYHNVKEIRFDFSTAISQKNRHVVIWAMHLKAAGLNNGKEVIVHGNSVIEFGPNNKVIYHRDYFDMGEFIYEDVPVVGSVIRYIKKKLKEHK